MDDVLMQLLNAAYKRGEVGSQQREDGVMLLAYPLPDGVVMGMGTGPGNEGRMRTVLRRRSENPERYGKWLPALFNDGSCFVLMRLHLARDSFPPADPAQMEAGAELIR